MKKLLHIVPYQHLYPPKNGGMLRNYFLCYELSKYFQVTLLTFQPESEFVDGVQGYRWNTNIRVISLPLPGSRKGIFARLSNAVRGRWYQKNLFRSAGSYVMEGYPVLRQLLQSESFDYVLFEHLFSLELQPLVRRFCPGARILFDAHNVDHLLYAQENDISMPAHRRAYEEIRTKEMTLFKTVDLFLACSDHDLAILEELNEGKVKGITVPNGADTSRATTNQRVITSVTPSVLFCGSLDYEPNIDGLRWFCSDIWPKVRSVFPGSEAIVVGRNPQPSLVDFLSICEGANLVGEVDDVRPFYENATVAIAPLRMGSGTRLKILEAMALGTPMVSTGLGAEGIRCINGVHIMLADDNEKFATAIIRLLRDYSFASQLSESAKCLVEQEYSWEVIGKRLAMALEEI